MKVHKDSDRTLVELRPLNSFRKYAAFPEMSQLKPVTDPRSGCESHLGGLSPEVKGVYYSFLFCQ